MVRDGTDEKKEKRSILNVTFYFRVFSPSDYPWGTVIYEVVTARDALQSICSTCDADSRGYTLIFQTA